MTSQVLLVRHGESVWNLEGRVQGQAPAPGLTDRGRAEAAAAALRLAAWRPTALWASDLRRAGETAEILGAHLGLVARAEPLLRERDWGDLQGRAGAEAWALVDRVRGTGRPPGGESPTDLEERVRRVLTAAAEGTGPVVLVSHGEWISRALMLVGLPAGKPANGDVLALPPVPSLRARRR